jgi:hypothetical protein
MAKFSISVSDKDFKPLREIIPNLSAKELKSLEECFCCANLHMCTLQGSQCNDGTGHCPHMVPVCILNYGGENCLVRI